MDDADGGAEAEREGEEDARAAEQDEREAEAGEREAEAGEREAEAGEREAEAGVGVGGTGEVSERAPDVGRGGEEEEDRDVESDYEMSGGVGGSDIGDDAEVDRVLKEESERQKQDDFAALDKAYEGQRVAELKGELKAVREREDEKDQLIYRSFGEFGTAMNVLGELSRVLKGASNMADEGGVSDVESEGGEVDDASSVPDGDAAKGEGGAAKSTKKRGSAAVEAAKEATAAAKEATAAAKEAAMAAKEGVAKTEVVRSSVNELGDDVRAYQKDFGGGAAKAQGRWLGGWRRGVVAVLIAILVGFGAGVAVEQRFVIVPLYDETEGWREHVWERYGDAVADCVIEARKRGGELVCELKVRPP